MVRRRISWCPSSGRIVDDEVDDPDQMAAMRVLEDDALWDAYEQAIEAANALGRSIWAAAKVEPLTDEERARVEAYAERLREAMKVIL